MPWCEKLLECDSDWSSFRVAAFENGIQQLARHTSIGPFVSLANSSADIFIEAAIFKPHCYRIDEVTGIF